MSSRLTDLARRLRRRLGEASPGAERPTPVVPEPSGEEFVRAWHDRTKHHPGRYARAAGYLDWETQPDPFRRWRGAPVVPLPMAPPEQEGPSYEAAWVHGCVPPRPLDLQALGQLFRDALGLSAWKSAGESTWPLRVDPSSGNLHPTEGWLLAPALPGLGDAPGVYHYSPYLHALERRAALSAEEWRALTAGLPAGAVLVGLSSAWWRESWKYGERAYRYCQHDLGHCIGTVAVAAAGLGWRATLLEGASDPELRVLLGLHLWPAGWPIEEQEQPDALLALTAEAFPSEAWRPPAEGVAALRPAARWQGVPGRLSATHQAWPVIEQMHDATARQDAAPAALYDAVEVDGGLVVGASPLALRAIVHQRRSAVDMDGRTGITRDAFMQVLRKLLPGRAQVPWTTLPWRPRVHPVLFVHRVQGLDPGLYLLARDGAPDRLRAMFDPAFAFTEVQPGLPLVLLREGDQRAVAQGLACGQDIASDGVFAVAMLGELREALVRWGPWAWKRLHWEAGLVGQVLYLEAEATGIRGTGIGCFFDDPTHQLLLTPEAWREDRLVDLYHFTVGGPVEDHRLQTLPPYAHREEALRQALEGGSRPPGQLVQAPPSTS